MGLIKYFVYFRS